MMEDYVIHEDCPIQHAIVDDINLYKGGDPVKLKKEQVERLADAGVELIEHKKENS